MTVERLLAQVEPPPRPRSLYLHIPFCFHKCHYCDFYSIVDTKGRQKAFTQRLIEEIRAPRQYLEGPIETIFVGGGTPTLLRPDLWRRLLAALHDLVAIGPEVEFTVEANPETVTTDLLAILVDGGVNRLSIGAQSFNPDHLKTLERWHDPQNVALAVELARGAGIANLSIDLIFAIPGQSIDDWSNDLERALALRPDHLSCYSLTYEPNTAMTQRLHLGQFEPVDEDVEAEMFMLTRRRLAEAGLAAYEISNFARPDRQCRHNLVYWRDEDWLAFGPSACGHIGDLRWKNAAHLGEYLDSEGWAPTSEIERVAPPTCLAERLMMGLRLTEGVDIAEVEAEAERLGVGEALRRTVEDLIAAGSLEQVDQRLRIAESSLLIANSITAQLMAAVDP